MLVTSNTGAPLWRAKNLQH